MDSPVAALIGVHTHNQVLRLTTHPGTPPTHTSGERKGGHQEIQRRLQNELENSSDPQLWICMSDSVD